jgi:hypothetical protein
MSTLQSSRRGAAEESRSDRVSGPERVRVLAVAAVGPVVIGFAAIAAVLALVSALAAGATFSTAGVLVAACPGWLAAWHVPVAIGGHTLGALPLLPTILVMLLVGRSAAGAADRIGARTPSDAVPVVVVLGGVHAVCGVALAMVSSRPGLYCSPVPAFFLCGVLAAVAALGGVARRCGLLDAGRVRADPAVAVGVRCALLGGCALLAVSALVLGGGLIGSWSAVVHTFRAGAPDFGSGLGMSLLSLAYLPNVLVGVCSFVAGPGASVGHATISPLTFHAGPVPGVPVLAMVPRTPATWWAVLLVLPVLVGGLVGWFCRRAFPELSGASPFGGNGGLAADDSSVTDLESATDLEALGAGLDVSSGVAGGADRASDRGSRWVAGFRGVRVRAVLVAALAIAIVALVLAGLSGGALAGGPFDPVTVPAGLFAALLFVGVAAGGLLTTWLTTPRAASAEPEVQPEAIPDGYAGDVEDDAWYDPEAHYYTDPEDEVDPPDEPDRAPEAAGGDLVDVPDPDEQAVADVLDPDDYAVAEYPELDTDDYLIPEQHTPTVEATESDRAQADRAQTDPAEADPAEADPAEADPAEADRTQADRTQADRARGDRAETGRAETDPARAGRVRDDRAETGRTADPNRSDPA